MKDFLNKLYLIFKCIIGIFSFKTTYKVSFIKNKGIWFVDIPWKGDVWDLEMVGGAVHLLDKFDEANEGRVTLQVSLRKCDNSIVLSKTKSTLTGGAYYQVTSGFNFQRSIWVCPVTLCVLGKYPKYLYLKKYI